MRKIATLLVLTIGLLAVSQAQPRAVGARLGYGLEASYQHTLGKNMVEAELGLYNFLGFDASATYDWIFSINSWPHKGEWNWYAGVGAGLGMNWFNYDYFFVGVAGRIGVEYNFWFPLQLSVDYRPIIGPYFGEDGTNGFNVDAFYVGAIGLSVRYRF